MNKGNAVRGSGKCACAGAGSFGAPTAASHGDFRAKDSVSRACKEPDKDDKGKNKRKGK